MLLRGRALLRNSSLLKTFADCRALTDYRDSRRGELRAAANR